MDREPIQHIIDYFLDALYARQALDIAVQITADAELDRFMQAQEEATRLETLREGGEMVWPPEQTEE